MRHQKSLLAFMTRFVVAELRRHCRNAAAWKKFKAREPVPASPRRCQLLKDLTPDNPLVARIAECFPKEMGAVAHDLPVVRGRPAYLVSTGGAGDPPSGTGEAHGFH